jgi:hypothetical protein
VVTGRGKSTAATFVIANAIPDVGVEPLEAIDEF